MPGERVSSVGHSSHGHQTELPHTRSQGTVVLMRHGWERKASTKLGGKSQHAVQLHAQPPRTRHEHEASCVACNYLGFACVMQIYVTQGTFLSKI